MNVYNTNNETRINQAIIIKSDLIGDNGVIHFIDDVLIPRKD
jgi:uncharacterized surface protein with fasciclin (FAS1) repeats